MCAYLADFRRNPGKRSEYSGKFFKYLLSVCWPKIYRRISSWRGLGFIYKIFQTKVKFTSERYKHWNEVQYDVKNERYLVDIFSRYPNVIEGLKYASTSLPHGADSNWEPPAEELLRFDSLIAAINNAAPQLYTKETAEDFHMFLYASFVTFGRSLCQLCKAIGLEKQGLLKPEANLRHIFNAFRGQAELLLFLITSSTFKKHIEVFCSIDGLGINDLVPDVKEREIYEKFGEGLKIWDYELVKGRKRKAPCGTVRTNQATPESRGVGTGKESQSTPESGDGNDDENESELEVRSALSLCRIPGINQVQGTTCNFTCRYVRRVGKIRSFSTYRKAGAGRPVSPPRFFNPYFAAVY